MVNCIANGLHKLGLGKGDRICLFTPNRPEYTIMLNAASTIGAVVTPMNPAYKEREITYQLARFRGECDYGVSRFAAFASARIKPCIVSTLKAYYRYWNSGLVRKLEGNSIFRQTLARVAAQTT